jgi:hypothetical protein
MPGAASALPRALAGAAASSVPTVMEQAYATHDPERPARYDRSFTSTHAQFTAIPLPNVAPARPQTIMMA